VIQPPASKKIPNTSVPSKLHVIAGSNQPIPTATPSRVKSQITLLLSNKEPDFVNQAIIFNDPIIVQGMRNKKHILEDYQDEFGTNSNDLIVTRKKVRSLMISLFDCSQMRPSLNKWYRVGDLRLYNIITTIIKEGWVSFSKEDLSNLRLVNKDYTVIVPKVIRWLQINFTPLRKPRLGYEHQECIDPHRVEMASAVMIYFGLDPGKFVHFLSGEYTGQYQDA
jgi:hypothetical protein